MMAATLVAATSCSDFDDYNKEVADATPSANQTLWDNIQQNGQLSEFAELVRKSGFDKELSASHCYTVWAPQNGTFNAAQYQALDSKALLRQFVKNHIADYSHSATGTLDERVLMLNEKSYDFGGAASYTLAEQSLAQANLPSSNGLLHIINGSVPFYPNIYEYVTDSLLSASANIDSLRHFVKASELVYLDEDASVPGPIVNGMQTYVDSVMVTTNTLWSQLGVRMINEDSTYTVLLPTNTAWNKAYDRIKDNYRYITTLQAQSFSNGNIDAVPQSISVDPVYWQDSLTRQMLVANLFYSNNDAYNVWMDGGTPSAYGIDTLRSTTYAKLSNPQNILSESKQTVAFSNGRGLVVDSLAMYPWETYAPELVTRATSSSNIGRVVTGSYENWAITFPDPEMEDLHYIHVTPNGDYARPELDLYISGVLSTTYDIYCVFAPAYDLRNPDLRPNRVIFTLNYCDEKGALKDYVFLDESESNVNWFKETFPGVTDNNSNRTTIRAFSNNPAVIDTVYIGEFTFPACYAGLGSSYRPNIKITSPFSVFNKDLTNTFTRDLRIASIILKPKELVEFEESNK